MYEKLAEAINQLNERESKRMLLHLFREAEMAEHNLDEQRLIKRFHRVYEDLIRLQPEKPLTKDTLNHWHIVFGDSVAGSLKVGLGSIHARRERIRVITTDLSKGPLTHLDEADGVRNRMAWIKELMDGYPYDDDSIHSLADQLDAIRSVPEQVPITIWASDNAWEQCGLDLVVYLLRGRMNPIHVINPSVYEKQLSEELGEERHSAYSGESLPETLVMLFKKHAQNPPLTENERRQLENEWRRLSDDSAVLRIWEDDRVQPVTPDYFDDDILRCARRLAQQEEDSRQGFLCLRLIGEVIGEVHEKQWVGDTFIYWRIKALVAAGKMTVIKAPNKLMHQQLVLNNRS
ncbi:DUF1835 domain-containing protein [Sporolactobacillus sp. STCC-11]|uniref:DUF1835 domain-containing protein n=1 Tax=Sporolactobacillus caesalpiniae TaxID=3230362 RepID=UPI0033956EA7